MVMTSELAGLYLWRRKVHGHKVGIVGWIWASVRADCFQETESSLCVGETMGKSWKDNK